MARGWASKSIESRQDDVARQAGRKEPEPRSTAEQAALARRQTLELARARTLADLRRASQPAHRTMLEQALDALDEQLHALDR